MVLRYNLSVDCFYEIFNLDVSPTLESRVEWWDLHMKPIYKLDYNEELYRDMEGYWGYVYGDEAHINWFILRWL